MTASEKGEWKFNIQKTKIMIFGPISLAQSLSPVRLCNTMNRSTPGLPVHHQLPEFTQTHVHWVCDVIQPSHPLSSPSPPAPNPSQHQSLFQCVNSSHEVAKVLEFQPQHHFLQRNPRADPFQNGLVGSPCSPRDSQESSPIRNEAGQILIEFCQENALVIAKTFFQQHKRRLYTGTSPDDQYQNQIDYILCRQRWKSSIQSRVGADWVSDHELLTAKFRHKFTKVGKTTRPLSSNLHQVPYDYTVGMQKDLKD